MDSRVEVSEHDEPLEPPPEDNQLGLNQIRVYLVKPGTELPDGAFRDLSDGEALDIRPIDSHGLRGYLGVAASLARRPDWLPVLEEILGDEIPYRGNRHISAVLMLEREEKTFALTFGYGRHLLEPDALEPDFGLRTAAGLIDPAAIASVDSRAFEATVLQVRRQSSRGTGTRGIGLDVGREMLRAIAGELLDESIGTRVTGSDSLGLTAELDATDLGPRLDALGVAYSERRYVRSFSYLDRWQRLRATDPVGGELDEVLLARLERRWEAVREGADPAHLPGAAGDVVLTVPQIIEYNSSGS